MKLNAPVKRPAKEYLFCFLFLVLSVSVSAQSDFRSYGYWTHPVIKALERHDRAVIAFSKPGSNLVNLCIADTSAGIAYYVSQYGFIFDTLHLTDDRKKEIQTAGKHANPFHWFEANISQYLPVLDDAKEFLRENGSNFKKANYLQQRVLTLPLVKKAPSTLAKLLAIEEMERECKGIDIHFNWYIHWPKDICVLNRLSEGKKPGSLIIHGTPDSGYSEFINKELLSGIRTARLEHTTGAILFYDWKNQAIDSFFIRKSKVAVLVQEKTDVFGLYRAWLEWCLQNINASIPAWQYAANCEWLKNRSHFLYADFTNERNSKTTLSGIQEEKKRVLDKIEALTGPDAALFSTIIAHPRYDGYREEREWDVTNGDGAWVTSLSYTSGNKRYELTDHRGNVIATVSDRKTGIDINGDGTIDRYEADITTATDYYPFGSLMPERKYSKDQTYRYGFNGKENDNEAKGEGNQQDYGMRIYDPRIGRFLSVDPITGVYPSLTPYQFASNTPIQAVDLDGLEQYFYGGVYIVHDNLPRISSVGVFDINMRRPATAVMPAKAKAKAIESTVATINRSKLAPRRTELVQGHKLSQREIEHDEEVDRQIAFSKEMQARSAADPISYGGPGFGLGLVRDPFVQLTAASVGGEITFAAGGYFAADGLQSGNYKEAAFGGLMMLGGKVPAIGSKGISTPYGSAEQSFSKAALNAKGEIMEGATLYRIGTLGKSQAAEAQFWSLENPALIKDINVFAEKYGIPAENLKSGNFFIETGKIKSAANFVTREAPAVGTNGGGSIEAVVNPNGVKLESFHTITF